MRGKRLRVLLEKDPLRSIPAYAGETPVRGSSHARRKVDPRVCGGNSVIHDPQMVLHGRSPRMRGKLAPDEEIVELAGSIPAYAGETQCALERFLAQKVDPRVCGGNHYLRTGQELPTGRSPRMRGKRMGSR